LKYGEAAIMKTPKGFVCIVISVLLSIPFSGFSQVIEQGGSNADQRLIEAAKEIMNSVGTCALITLDDEGAPRVRAMAPFAPEEDLTVWFGTNSKSRKVDQIKKDPRVTLYYLDKDASGYVIIHGLARLVNDPQEKEKRWKAEWEAFYPDKTNGYLLIEVAPIWMEVLSPSRGIAGDPVTWQPPVVYF
jgi:general stress protein 26